MPQTRDQRRASDAVAAWLAHHEKNNAWMVATTGLDAGTVGTFLAGATWPKVGNQGKFEKAVGWPAGTIRQIANTGVVPDGLLETRAPTSPPATVGGSTQDATAEEESLLYRRPEGLTDEEWDRVKQESREFIEWQIEKASRER